MSASPTSNAGTGQSGSPSRASLGAFGAWARRWPAEFWVALVAFLAFLPALRAGFVFDDTSLIVKNPYAHELKYLLRPFTTHFWDSFRFEGIQAGLQYYRPLVSSSFVVDWVISGGKPWLFHLVNILAHATATLLAVRIAKRWIGHTGLAILVGLVFALHPSRTENVIWVVGRTDLFMACFLFATIELVHAASQRPNRRFVLLIAAGITAIFALLSKEPSLLLCLLLGVDFLRRDEGPAARRVQGWAALAGGALAIVYVVARNLIFPVHPSGQVELMPQYGFLSVYSYLERALFPWPQTFCHRLLEYDGTAFVYPLPLVAAGMVVALTYLALVVGFLRRDPATALILVVAGAFLGPLLNFTYTQLPFTACDRFLYLPLFLGATGLMRGFKTRLSKLSARPWARAIAGGLCVIAIGVDVYRVQHYQDDLGLFRHELALNQNNVVAYDRLSSHYAERGEVSTALDLALKGREAGQVHPLFRPPYKRAEEYTMIVSLLAAQTADGDHLGLEALYRPLDELAAGRKPSPVASRGRAIDLELTEAAIKRVLEQDARLRPLVAAAAAFLATRLEQTERARELLSRVSESEQRRLPDPLNLLLAHARVGDFVGAERRATAFEQLGSSHDRDFLDGLQHARARIRRARLALDHAETAPEPRKSILRAQSSVELGAYRRALHELDAVYAANPAAVAPLYVQLLVALRLEQRAQLEAARFLGPERARQAVQQLRTELPPAVRMLDPVADDRSGLPRLPAVPSRDRPDPSATNPG